MINYETLSHNPEMKPQNDEILS